MKNNIELGVAITNFLYVGWYDGYEDEIREIYYELTHPVNGQISRPRNWYLKNAHGVNEYCGVLWSWLVLQFGDYGTSPRFGWLEPYKCEYLTKVVNNFLCQIEEEEKNENS